MKEIEIKVNIENGLHARPAGELVKLLKPFKSSVNVLKDGKTFNMKSILHLMSTSIREKDVIHVQADGEDEEEVISQLLIFFSGRKSEPE